MAEIHVGPGHPKLAGKDGAPSAEPLGPRASRPRDSRAARTAERLPALLVFSAALAAAVHVGGAFGLTLDDAYIHLTFARNLHDGHGFAFNPGEFSLGFSSPLWVALLALVAFIPTDLPTAAKAMSSVAFAGAALVFHQLVLHSLASIGPRPEAAPPGGPDRVEPSWAAGGQALIAGLGLAACGNLGWLAASGMETSLFLLLGLLAILVARDQRRRPYLAGLVLGLLVLTRSTGLILVVLLAALGAASPKRRRNALIGAAVALALAAPWHLFALVATGDLLPPTMAGKLASHLFNSGLSLKGMAVFILEHLKYLYLADRGPLYLAAFAIAAAIAVHGPKLLPSALTEGEKTNRPTSPTLPTLARGLNRLSPAAVLIVWELADLLVHSILFRSTANSTPYHYLRYQIMLIPAAIAAAAIALHRAAFALRAAAAKPDDHDYAQAAAILFHGLAFALLALPLIGEARELGQWKGFYRGAADHLARVHHQAALWARNQTDPAARIASLDIGVLGFYSHRYVIDLGGLTDPAALPFLKQKRLGPYLIQQRATHLFHLVRHDSNVITGVLDDDGKLYRLDHLADFNCPPYAHPAPNKLLPHSLGVKIFAITPIAPAGP